MAAEPARSREPASPLAGPLSLQALPSMPLAHPENPLLSLKPHASESISPNSMVRWGSSCGGTGACPGCTVPARVAAGEIPALAKQNYPTIGFSVPSTWGGFVWAITAGLLSDGRDV